MAKSKAPKKRAAKARPKRAAKRPQARKPRTAPRSDDRIDTLLDYALRTAPPLPAEYTAKLDAYEAACEAAERALDVDPTFAARVDNDPDFQSWMMGLEPRPAAQKQPRPRPSASGLLAKADHAQTVLRQLAERLAGCVAQARSPARSAPKAQRMARRIEDLISFICDEVTVLERRLGRIDLPDYLTVRRQRVGTLIREWRERVRSGECTAREAAERVHGHEAAWPSGLNNRLRVTVSIAVWERALQSTNLLTAQAEVLRALGDFVTTDTLKHRGRPRRPKSLH